MTWEPLNLSAPEYAQPTEPPIVLGLFYRGKRHALSGPPEAAKTLAALIAGLEWRRAGHGRFALIDFEQGPRGTRLMLEELGATPAEIADVYYVTPEGPPSDDDIAALAAAGVTLAVIDACAGAYDVTGLDDNKRSDAERFGRLWVTPLWQRDIAAILVDHVVKNAEQRGKFAIGSERKLGQVDVHLGLEAVTHLTRGGRGIVRVSVHKDRPAHLQRPHPCELHLASDPETHRIRWETRDADVAATTAPDLPPAARKLLDALEAVTDEGTDAVAAELVDWIAANHGHGLKRETVSRSLGLLSRLGFAECTTPDTLVAVPKRWRVTRVITRDPITCDPCDRPPVGGHTVTITRHTDSDGHMETGQ